MPTARNTILWSAAGLLTAAGLLCLYAQMRWDRRFDAPVPHIAASHDPKLVERGRYLVYGPAHCVHCHRGIQDDGHAMVAVNGLAPLAGGRAFHLPPGTFYAPNITSDDETGIGRETDGQLARFIRYGVHADGRAALPFMTFQNMSDEDLSAILSFLRSQAPTRHAVSRHSLNLLGKLVMALVIKPQGPRTTPMARTPMAPAVGRGAYLAQSVAQCAVCHTQRSLVDGTFTGPYLAGGQEMPDDGNPKLVFVTPNLTPDAATGRIVAWSRDTFVSRFRMGQIIPDSHMPWEAFLNMSDEDLSAIYQFLRTLPPIHNDPGPALRPAR